ncbi:Polyketide cyclase / dehydrase and lipid transport [Bosea sp. OK403]|uniref:SRPBCC family protein n=1 Tax=Bosea sp. OK403 TaxID=1855286 RepID=UPI0008EBD88C|nr:SRPBCC family protein [Bosea sp. OK403]SFJ15445.1 Polyketide cyclase / dehydrase and lipid transport [Bosea sp. OK403]
MLKTVLLSLLALLATGIVVVLILAAMKPDSFQVQRAIAINAPPERIYPLIADFRAWGAWSPWEKKDPNLKRSFSGAETGKGAIYAWAGDKNVGEGSMEIVTAEPSSKVGLKLDFIKPFEAHNAAVFALQLQGTTTNVTWTMTGPAPFFAKIIHVFFNMDRMVGGDFEAGLASLKAQAERPA